MYETPWPERLRDTANRIAERLGERDDVDAVLLYGSVARGDAGPHSDIDLLVIGQDAGQTIAGLREWLAEVDVEQRAGLAFHTRESFAELAGAGSRFLVHLRREGAVLLERTGELQNFLASSWEPVHLEQEIAVELDRLANYERPELFGGRFLFPLAHVYTIGKAIVMARLAADDIFEFNRREAFRAYARRFPGIGEDVLVVAALEPFLARTRRQPAALPFPPYGPVASRELVAGVGAVRRIAQVDA